MKKFLSVFLRFARVFALPANAPHDDTLRANQGSRPATFSAWRALVSGGHGG